MPDPVIAGQPAHLGPQPFPPSAPLCRKKPTDELCYGAMHLSNTVE